MLAASYALKGLGAVLVLIPLAVEHVPDAVKLALFAAAVPIGYGAVVLASRSRDGDGGA